MKVKIIIIVLLSVLNSVYAATGTVTGKISAIRSHDTSVAVDWIKLEDVSIAGNCNTHSGLVNFRLADDERGERHLSLALAAKMADKTVTIGYDDVNLISSGTCLIRTITL